MDKATPGKALRVAVKQEQPLQMVGTINAYSALLAEQAGFKAIYLSGAGVANASLGLPDLAITNSTDVLTEVQRITDVVSLPLLVDVDTGWGNRLTIARAVKQLEKAGAAGLHIEDQIFEKRCGHRPNKQCVEPAQMVDRIKAAVDARTDKHFVIMARTDALASEGMAIALERVQFYVDAGADMIFFEAATQLEQYQRVVTMVKVPILANITEFGNTPLFTLDELRSVGVSIALYPLTAFRMMNAAAVNAYQTLRKTGTQKSLIKKMQTRDELYEILKYTRYE
jgi:methylisocitrate lyase